MFNVLPFKSAIGVYPLCSLAGLFALWEAAGGHKTKKATSFGRGLLSESIAGRLFRYYVCRAGAFFALANLVLNYLTFAQA